MSFFFAPRSKVKPQFTGLALQTSTSAVPISLWYGKNRGAGNLIWQGDFASHKQSAGGKGGGKGATSYTYSGSFELGLCWGPITGITKVWKDQSTETDYTKLGFSLFTGTNPQAPWGYLTTAHPTQALGYPDIAYLAVQNYDLGSSNVFPQHSFEVEALLEGTGVGGTVSDADPAQVISDFLSNPTHGVGFDTSIISNLMSTAAATTTGDSAFQTYCQAMGFAMSPFMSDQKPAGEIIQQWADLCNSAIVWTGYSLKFHPYGSDNITANGVTYLADFPLRYTLTDSDYIYEKGTDPIQFNRTDPADAFNAFSIIINNRSNEYNELPVHWRDQGLVDQYGLKNESSLTTKEITDPTMASIMVTFMGQRKAYIRNTFEFKLPPSFSLLEPMDILECNDPRLGIFLVLIREIVEADNDDLSIVAEEYPSSISTNTSTTTQAVSNTPVNTNISPGPVNPPIILQPPPVLTGGNPEIWAAVSGGDGTTANPYWGGCDVYISTDGGTSYNMVGTIENPARMGKLTSALPAYAGANPDVTDPLQIDSTMSGAEFNDATTSDAAAGVTLTYIQKEGTNLEEFLSYTNATLTGTNLYNLTDLYRGLDGSTAGAHALGANFARLDDLIFKYAFPLGLMGSTIYVKFVSFNIWNGGQEDISTVTPYSFTIGSSYAYGTALSQLNDVNTAGLVNGDTLVWDNTSGMWVPGSGGGGGASVTVSTTAPATPTAGDLWWKSDEGRLKIYYNDGTSSQWVDAGIYGGTGGSGGGGGLFGPLITVPTRAGTGMTSNLNLGTATITDVPSGVVIGNMPSNNNYFRGMYGPAPAAPYVITALISPQLYTESGPYIGWYDGTNKLELMGRRGNSSNFFYYTYSDPTTRVTATTYNPVINYNPVWIQFGDDGTNVYWNYSFDGLKWYPIKTQAKSAGYLGSAGYTNLALGCIDYSDFNGGCSLTSWVQG